MVGCQENPRSVGSLDTDWKAVVIKHFLVLAPTKPVLLTPFQRRAFEGRAALNNWWRGGR
jgi:hypothetical protein